MRKLVLIILIALIVISCRQTTEPIDDDFMLPVVPDSAEVTFNSNGWAEIRSLPNELMYENIRLIEAANKNIAWVSDWDIGTIYKTENGGKSWITLNPPLKGKLFYLEALDSLTLWIGSQVGEIFKSTDGGYNWVLQHDSYFINYIEFFDSQNGIAMGDSPLSNAEPIEIIHTTDGGTTWMNKNVQLYGYTTNMAVSFANPDVGFMRITESSNILHKTIDGGVTWNTFTPPLTGQNIYILATVTADVVLISFGTSVISTDGGNTWTQQFLPSFPTNFSKVRNDPNYIFTIAGTVHRSSNSGRDWEAFDTGISTIWQAVSSPKKNIVWLSGRFGKVTYKVLD